VAQFAQVSLTAPQQAVHNSLARFKVIAAGRRLGKTTLAAIECLLEACKTENDYGDPLGSDSEVVYIGVDKEQAKRNVWNMIQDIAREMGIFVFAHQNSCVLIIDNGVCQVRVRLLGMDRPDSARGMKLRYAVLDEYADMPDNVWDEVIRPALMDCRGGAMFIGTPKGKNHFYRLFSEALTGDDPEWEAFSFMSHDNSTLNRDELEKVALDYARGSPELYAQEIEGKFISKGGALFHEDDFPRDAVEPKHGSYFLTVDLAGFERESAKKTARISRLDDSAICINKAYNTMDKDGKADVGWWVKEIQHGRWDTEETAKRIVDAAVAVKAQTVGIEKGVLAQAVAPYLASYQAQRKVWLNVVPLTHGNQRKYDRIQWGLQGRAKRRLVTLNPGEWNSVLLEQAIDFPSKLTHDDLLDALAYQDQVADWVEWEGQDNYEKWEAVDPISGY